MKGEVHDAGVQRVHLCVTVHTVKLLRRLAGLLGERTVAKVRDGVEGRGLGWGGRHGGQPSLSLQLSLELVVLLHGQAG